MNEMTSIESKALLADVTAFLWAEAEILDDKRYDDWLALWTKDGFYTMPIGDTPDDKFADALNLCHDNDKMRHDRIGRFQQGFSISSAPPAETVRSLSRFVIQEATAQRIVVRCSEQLVEDKFGRQRLFGANVTYTLLPAENGFKIRDKVIRLLNSDGMLTAISYLF